MRTFKKVKGAPVFNGENGRLIGVVSDLTYDACANCITGYWISHHKWWSKQSVLPFSSLFRQTADGMISKEAKPLRSLSPNEARCFNGKDRLAGKMLKSQTGKPVGIVEDVYFLEDSGKIVGYELTEGLFADLTRGQLVKK